MNYQIQSLLDPKSESNLTRIEKSICTIWFDNLGEARLVNGIKHTMGQLCRIENQMSDYVLKNIPELKEDGEDAPRWYVLDYYEKFTKDNLLCLVKQKTVDSLCLITDHLIWSNLNGSWNLKVDVGFRFIFTDNSSLILIAKNSSVGLFDIWYSYNLDATDIIINLTKTKLIEFWGFELTLEENFKKAERIEKIIF